MFRRRVISQIEAASCVIQQFVFVRKTHRRQRKELRLIVESEFRLFHNEDGAVIISKKKESVLKSLCVCVCVYLCWVGCLASRVSFCVSRRS